ncbi:MAG: AtpZ/AtpI family protein [Eubacteriales bacterium]|nr:AtpZ/AtpI family protein [Eubacteriales bacterium]MDD3072937.1 AtpZ/AtpI family protein [Eubacteriales bacterium]MDD4078158.1 AtpZ/AtpI family protein [Eubacteriales bacterium]MDD4768445.1 AtpZ/AtpI family protein [Eubacteriales bacterium]
MKPADWMEILRYLSLVTGIGLTFIAAVLLGWWLGSTLQDLWNWSGWFFVGLLSGVAAGIYAVYYMLKKMVLWK